MEYYNRYDQTYVRLAQDESKVPLSKIEVLDHLEYCIYEITDDIILDSESYSMSYNQGIQGKLSFSIYNREGKYTISEDSPFWFDTKIKFYKGLRDDSGNIYWFSKGVFTVTSLSQEDNIINVEAVDKFGLFTSDTGGACLETSTNIDLGVTMEDIICDMLQQNRGNGKPTDPIVPIIDFDTRSMTLGEDLEISSGQYFGDILIELANSMRCRIYYDTFGHLVFSKGSDNYSYSSKAPMWTFDDDTTEEFLKANIDYDFSGVKNRVTVWGEDMDGKSYVGTAMNDNPKSPVRVSLVGYRVDQTRETMMGYNQAMVDAYAETYLRMKSILGLSVKMDCTMLPHLNVEDVVLIKSNKLNLDNERFLVSEVSYSGNKMSLSLCNIDSLPYCEEFQ